MFIRLDAMGEEQFNKLRLHPDPAIRFALHDTIKKCFHSIHDIGDKFSIAILYKTEYERRPRAVTDTSDDDGNGGELSEWRPSEYREYVVLYHSWCSAIIRTTSTDGMMTDTFDTIEQAFGACELQWRRAMGLLGLEAPSNDDSDRTKKSGYEIYPRSAIDNGYTWRVGPSDAHLIRLDDC